ncbi:thermonuclease family protein [Halomarina litorea]|uniref:thermonuclease family protein n=1 Tax=Halomarina litorea TaxID=2961595 RepID=UPI0020C35D90|nr:hypothetical protein [Halomarina sp. BCD28]
MSHHTFAGNAWEFPARLADDGVVDGDTVDIVCDVGFDMRRTIRVRVFGVDTAEIHTVGEDTEEFQRGQEHKAFVEQWFMFESQGSEYPLSVTTLKETGKFGRYVAVIHGPEGESLTSALVEEFDDV